MSETAYYSTNLRRLFAWHGLSSKEAADVLGASENSLSGWLTGKRPPSGEYLTKIGLTFDVNPVKLQGDPDAFGAEIADVGRFHRAEANIAASTRATS